MNAILTQFLKFLVPDKPKNNDTYDEYEGIRVGASGTSSTEGEGAGGAEGPDACMPRVQGAS